MSKIKNKNTKPEMVIRRGLHRAGFRYRLHQNSLPGKPDLVLKKYRSIIFINGCFWHGHNCSLFQKPKSNFIFWEQKIAANRARDLKNINVLLDEKWRVLVIWECSLRGKYRLHVDEVLSRSIQFLKSSLLFLTIKEQEV